MGTRGFASFRNKVRSAGRKLKRAEKTIPRRASSVAVNKIRMNIIDSDLIATWDMWQSVESQSLGIGKAAVLVKAPYAGYAEHGTGAKGDGKYRSASHVPVEEIFQWMLAKPTFAGEVSYYKASIIAQSLEREGQRQQPFFEPAWDETVLFTKQQMRDALRRAL